MAAFDNLGSTSANSDSNLPIGAVTVVGIWLFFKSPARAKEASVGFAARFKQFDPIGTLLFIPAIVCLLLALQWGGVKYAWSDGKIIALFILFGILLILFIAVQIWKGELATVPPRIASQRSVAAGSFFGLCLGASFFIFIYYLPIWFQAIKNSSATDSGIRVLPIILAQVIASVVTGGMTSKIGYYTQFMFFATVLMSIGAGLMYTFKVDSGIGMWIGYQVIFGLGSGCGFQVPLIGAQTALALEDVPIGTSVVMFIQLLGGALFTSIANNIFNNKLINNILAENLPGIDSNVIARAGATNIRALVPPEALDQVLVAYNDALTRAFQIALIMACISIVGAIFMEWKSVKGKKVDAVAA